MITLPSTPVLVVDLLGLVFAVVLLVEVLALRRVAEGSAVADNVTYIVLGTICLAASVLVAWVPRVVETGLDAGDLRLPVDALIVVSMAFFAVYFFRVRRALQRFLRVMSADDAFAASQVESGEDGDGVG